MDILAGFIFIGIPSVAILVGLLTAVATIWSWRSAAPPEAHYIASRMRALPVPDEDQKWLEELDALRLPYRHTIC